MLLCEKIRQTERILQIDKLSHRVERNGSTSSVLSSMLLVKNNANRKNLTKDAPIGQSYHFYVQYYTSSEKKKCTQRSSDEWQTFTHKKRVAKSFFNCYRVLWSINYMITGLKRLTITIQLQVPEVNRNDMDGTWNPQNITYNVLQAGPTLK